MLRKGKLESWQKKISECGNNAKKLYNLVTSITGSEKESPIPPSTLDQDLAEEFASYFIARIEKIYDNLNRFTKYYSEKMDVPKFKLVHVSQAHVERLIMSMPTKIL